MKKHVFYTGNKQYRRGTARPAACGKIAGEMDRLERALAVTIGTFYELKTAGRLQNICPDCIRAIENYDRAEEARFMAKWGYLVK